jgi:hypothetical protein
MSLPLKADERKRIPIWGGVICYFPDALAEVAKVSWAGNEQHNPGEPLHWARDKSTDQMEAAVRHQFDYATGVAKDVDDQYHLAKAIWRLCAELQLSIEKERNDDQT